ncbi:MAG: hypothetical protein WAV27_04735 [Xanthobacteraceae bacterium]
MTTPIETWAGKKAWDWIKGRATYLVSSAKRYAELEQRVTALENALKTQPADVCPYCGERAMRLKEQSGLMGDPGKQWKREFWHCDKCGKDYRKDEALRGR